MPLKLEITVGHVVRVEPHDPIVAGILEAEAAGISIEEYLKPIDRGVTPHELMEAVLCDCYLDEYAETRHEGQVHADGCLLYTSDAADDLLCVDLGGRRI